MKAANGETIRVGFGLGTNTAANDPRSLGSLVDALETTGFDSIWFSERVSGSAPDPIVAMSWAAARTERLKFGPAVQVVPGRNPVLLAKALASLDRISDGRLLPAFGLGAPRLAEHQAFGVQRGDRGAWFDEALPLMRRLWTEEVVTHHGERFELDDVRVEPKPVQDPLEVWMGGVAPSELRRVGRLGEGWLPSFCTPEDVRVGIPVIDDHSTAAGREPIDRGHFGALVVYSPTRELPSAIADRLRALKPDAAIDEVVVLGRNRIRDRLLEFCDAGATKFVLSPLGEPEDWSTEVATLAEAVLSLHD
ncbi:MAG: TIGR03619 family F420-dependent LLM class oxidoreductase [Microthrixaceae bacterium]